MNTSIQHHKFSALFMLSRCDDELLISFRTASNMDALASRNVSITTANRKQVSTLLCTDVQSFHEPKDISQ